MVVGFHKAIWVFQTSFKESMHTRRIVDDENECANRGTTVMSLKVAPECFVYLVDFLVATVKTNAKSEIAGFWESLDSPLHISPRKV